ncbi:hypothetical protein Pmani_016807 [Petrolisthes manimaculis]|uniref:Uncharacterized protein n=1 Tax=Petrolisthes manimaculis TaxID=1843537 RepID=A0AAE1U8D8_9EUCA|nr:hypothetical protein Pmani_016807 [Petrolisthes manimaculis]
MFSVTSERWNSFDFSEPLLIDDFNVLNARPKVTSDLAGFIKPFSYERQKSVSEEGAVGGAVVAGRDEDEPATEGMVVNTQLAGAWSPSLARTSGYRQQSPAALSVRPNPLMKTRSSTKK